MSSSTSTWGRAADIDSNRWTNSRRIRSCDALPPDATPVVEVRGASCSHQAGAVCLTSRAPVSGPRRIRSSRQSITATNASVLARRSEHRPQATWQPGLPALISERNASTSVVLPIPASPETVSMSPPPWDTFASAPCIRSSSCRRPTVAFPAAWETTDGFCPPCRIAVNTAA